MRHPNQYPSNPASEEARRVLLDPLYQDQSTHAIARFVGMGYSSVNAIRKRLIAEGLIQPNGHAFRCKKPKAKRAYVSRGTKAEQLARAETVKQLVLDPAYHDVPSSAIAALTGVNDSTVRLIKGQLIAAGLLTPSKHQISYQKKLAPLQKNKAPVTS